MTKEGQPEPLRLTGIHIDLLDHVVTLEATDGRKAKLAFGEPTTIFEAPPHPTDLPTQPDTPEAFVDEAQDDIWEEPPPAPSSAPVATSQETREKQATVMLSGRLRTQPKQGRPDRQGRPTAWARLAVEEDAEQAHLYTATFYRATTAIALGLPRGAELTVEGYPRAGDAARKRADSFAVLAIHNYPGKSTKQAGKGVT